MVREKSEKFADFFDCRSYFREAYSVLNSRGEVSKREAKCLQQFCSNCSESGASNRKLLTVKIWLAANGKRGEYNQASSEAGRKIGKTGSAKTSTIPHLHHSH